MTATQICKFFADFLGLCFWKRDQRVACNLLKLFQIWIYCHYF